MLYYISYNLYDISYLIYVISYNLNRFECFLIYSLLTTFHFVLMAYLVNGIYHKVHHKVQRYFK